VVRFLVWGGDYAGQANKRTSGQLWASAHWGRSRSSSNLPRAPSERQRCTRHSMHINISAMADASAINAAAVWIII
jgi:hypothetical protein